jgi:1-deoxy-D-xylulose-5-phosphate synthase
MPDSLLERIENPEDLSSLSREMLKELAEEMRQAIIDTVSKNGGHLGSNLGIVDLTVALHAVFSSPKDKLIFDTSHQSYPHKLLTGRLKRFATIGKKNGLAGFCDPTESEHDHFFAGHAGTALSLALGAAKARDILQSDEYIIPILGDASLTCGLTLEALNNIPKRLKNFIIILNDNNMSISNSVGAITNILSRIVNSPRSNRFYLEIGNLLRKIPGCGKTLVKQGHKVRSSFKNLVSSASFFEQFGLTYIGPLDGHNLDKLIDTISSAKKIERPLLIHVLTTKGKGMQSATDDPITYHGCNPFDKTTGQFHASSSKKTTFPKIFGKLLLKKAESNPHLVAITPAMPLGSCLDPFMEKYPERCLDVGIAEGHSVTFCGGIASDKRVKVICSIYGTFLQRAFDNVFHDVCLQGLSVIFAIDRAGLASYGPTHHAIYDIAFLSSMPRMIICQPRNGKVLKELFEIALESKDPIAIRYPNAATEEGEEPLCKREIGRGEILALGRDVLIIALGTMCDTALEVKKLLENEEIYATVLDPVFVKPLDTELLSQLLLTHNCIVTIEEHSLIGGLGSLINTYLIQNSLSGLQVFNFGIPDSFLSHGNRNDLLAEIGLDPASIASKIIAEKEVYATR